MKTIRTVFAIASVMACALIPIGIASASNSHAGQHGNHCGLGHTKHVKGQGGLKIGQHCTKAQHDQSADDVDAVDAD